MNKRKIPVQTSKIRPTGNRGGRSSEIKGISPGRLKEIKIVMINRARIRSETMLLIEFRSDEKVFRVRMILTASPPIDVIRI